MWCPRSPHSIVSNCKTFVVACWETSKGPGQFAGSLCKCRFWKTFKITSSRSDRSSLSWICSGPQCFLVLNIRPSLCSTPLCKCSSGCGDGLGHSDISRTTPMQHKALGRCTTTSTFLTSVVASWVHHEVREQWKRADAPVRPASPTQSPLDSLSYCCHRSTPIGAEGQE